MADSTTSTRESAPSTKKSADSEVADSKDFSVRVKDLASPETNPNFPRSIFASTVGSAAADADSYISVNDATHQPDDSFPSKSISGKAVQMNTGFDANGQPGNAGDWLVYAGGHWFVAKEL